MKTLRRHTLILVGIVFLNVCAAGGEPPATVEAPAAPYCRLSSTIRYNVYCSAESVARHYATFPFSRFDTPARSDSRTLQFTFNNKEKKEEIDPEKIIALQSWNGKFELIAVLPKDDVLTDGGIRPIDAAEVIPADKIKGMASKSLRELYHASNAEISFFRHGINGLVDIFLNSSSVLKGEPAFRDVKIVNAFKLFGAKFFVVVEPREQGSVWLVRSSSVFKLKRETPQNTESAYFLFHPMVKCRVYNNVAGILANRARFSGGVLSSSLFDKVPHRIVYYEEESGKTSFIAAEEIEAIEQIQQPVALDLVLPQRDFLPIAADRVFSAEEVGGLTDPTVRAAISAMNKESAKAEYGTRGLVDIYLKADAENGKLGFADVTIPNVFEIQGQKFLAVKHSFETGGSVWLVNARCVQRIEKAKKKSENSKRREEF